MDFDEKVESWKYKEDPLVMYAITRMVGRYWRLPGVCRLGAPVWKKDDNLVYMYVALFDGKPGWCWTHGNMNDEEGIFGWSKIVVKPDYNYTGEFWPQNSNFPYWARNGAKTDLVGSVESLATHIT